MKKVTVFILAGILCVFGIAVRAVSHSSIKDTRINLRPNSANAIDIRVKGVENSAGRQIYSNGEFIENKNFIGEEKAYEIVLKKAGLEQNEVSYKRVKLDFDDGIYIYEVEIKSGRFEYDADVNALNGEIVSFEKDFDD